MFDEKETKDFLNGVHTIPHLQHIAEFRKEYLLAMVESDLKDGTQLVLEDMDRAARLACKVWTKYEDDPMLQSEMAMEAATWNGDSHEQDPSSWTQEEIDLVDEWWEKTFPGEENPLYLYPTEPENDEYDGEEGEDENDGEEEDDECGGENGEDDAGDEYDYETARDRVQIRLNRGVRGGAGFIGDGVLVSGYLILRGTRKFSDYAERMVEDFGERIRPFLRSFYEAVRHYPGWERWAGEMSSEMEIAEYCDRIASKG